MILIMFCIINLLITLVIAFKLAPLFFKNHFAGSCYALGLFSFGFGGGAATLSNVKAFTGRYGFSVNAESCILSTENFQLTTVH